MTNPAKVLTSLEDFLVIPHQLAAFVTNDHKLQRCDSKTGCHKVGKEIHSHPAVDEKLLLQMREVFRPHMQAFYKITDRDFGWPMYM